MKNRITTVILALAVSIAPAAHAQDLSADEQHLVALINAARAEAGLGELQADPHLSSVARAHSQDMAENHFFSHVSPTSGDVGHRLTAAGVPYRAAGENIALDASVDDAHLAFMNSSAHRANVLNPDYTTVGIGVVRVGERVMVTEAFTRQHATQQAQAPAPEPTPQATPEPAADVAPEPPVAAPVEPSALLSPFELLSRVVGALDAPADEPASPQPAPEPRVTQPERREPGLWIVDEDGTMRRVELDAGALLRLLSVF